MTTENLTVRELLSLLAERVERDSHAIQVCMNDADNDGDAWSGDYLNAQHSRLELAAANINEAIENINDYFDVRENFENVSMDVNAFICEYGAETWASALRYYGTDLEARIGLESGEFFNLAKKDK